MSTTPTPTPTPKRVGPGQYTPGPIVRPTQTPVATPVLKPGVIASLNNITESIFPGMKLQPTTNFNLIESLSDFQINELGKILNKINYSVKNSKQDIKDLLTQDPTLISIVQANQTSFIDLKNALLRDYTPVNVKADEPTLPSRTISKVDPEAFGNVISSVFEKVAMKKGSKEQINALVQEFLPKLEGGTLTEVKKVKNPKTGKLENVTTVTPGMSQETAKISIEEKIKELYPEEVDVASRINFNSWLDKNSRGV